MVDNDAYEVAKTACEVAYAEGITNCKKEYKACKDGKDQAGIDACKVIRETECKPNEEDSNDANYAVYEKCDEANQLLNGNCKGGGCEPLPF